MSRRISNSTAREVVILDLKQTGKRVPSRELSYIDFAIVTGAPQIVTRKEACLYVRTMANRILDERRARENVTQEAAP